MDENFGNIYESFFYNSAEGIIIFDLNGKIINANAKAENIFNRKKNGLKNLPIGTVIDEKYQADLLAVCNSIIDGTDSTNTKTFVIPDFKKNHKQNVLVLYLNNHIRSADGPLIAAIIRDETQRSNEKLELLQSHERFRKAFHNNPVAQLVVRVKDKRIIDVNNRFLTLSGYGKEKVLKSDFSSIGMMSCTDNGIELHPSLIPENTINDCEAFMTTKDGRQMSVLQSHVIIRLNNSAHELWTVIDLTALKEAEHRLMLLNEELEHKVQDRTKDLTNLLEREKIMNDLKSRFVSMASHEFRTPLTTVLVSTGLIETHMQHNDLDKCVKHIGRIKSSIKVLTEILEDFLSLDKIEHGQVKSYIATIDLEDFAEKIITETDALLKKGQAILYTIKGNTTIKQDINILKKVMLNLLSNAGKYSNEGIINWTITVKKDKLVLSVADNGIGIPLADQEHIFSRFFRARNAEVLQGSGLGLNIVKKYVEILNGKVSFVSAENVGSTFTVEVPVLK